MERKFSIIKNDILGHTYDLSIAYVSAKKSRELNKKWRSKDRATNILSFALSKNSGELVLCKEVIKKETKKFERNFTELAGFLVIHGMLHLKGLDHSSTMERREEKYDQKYFSRNRRGLGNDTSRDRRILKGRKKS